MMNMLEGSTIAWVRLVKDTDPKDGSVNWWWNVALEPKDQEVVQTVEMCVTFDEEKRLISQFLVEGGWCKPGGKCPMSHYENQTQRITAMGTFEVVGEADPLCDENDEPTEVAKDLGLVERWMGGLERSNPAALGKKLFEYLEETNHGNWEGYNGTEIRAALAFLKDFKLYVDNSQ